MADSNGTEQAPHYLEYLKYVVTFLAAVFGWLWRRQVARVDKLDKAIADIREIAITKSELTDAVDSIRHSIDRVGEDMRHQSDRIDKLYQRRRDE